MARRRGYELVVGQEEPQASGDVASYFESTVDDQLPPEADFANVEDLVDRMDAMED